MIFGKNAHIRRLESQLRERDNVIAQLRAQVAELADLAGVDVPAVVDPSAPSDEELRLLRGGEKIAAIRAYRERTGAGLADAKDAIEAADGR